MIFFLQCAMMTIALSIFVLQHRLKRNMSIIASRLVYWTTLLFTGIIFNRILYELYPVNYALKTYYTKENLILIAGLIGAYIILQLASPSLLSWKWVKVIRTWIRQRRITGSEELEEGDNKRNIDLKEHQFETFLETICWLGFTLSLMIQGVILLQDYVAREIIIYEGVTATTCLMMLLSIPIAIRQIIFYLYRIRTMKLEDNVPEKEVKFQKKLRKQNIYL